MTDPEDIKHITERLNFFTGFFTTADDWNEGQQYHLEKRKLHNRGLHTPGIIAGEEDELRVRSAGGLDIRVLPGAALDGDGNLIYLHAEQVLAVQTEKFQLPAIAYLAMRYGVKDTHYVDQVEARQYSGFTRISEIPLLEVSSSKPDNKTCLELARIHLQPGVTAVADPKDPASPGANEIDRRYVCWAGSVGVAGQALSPAMLEEVIRIMGYKRADFAALFARFPVPSIVDVRYAAMTLSMLAAAGCLRPDQLPDTLAAIAAAEQGVGQEIKIAFPDAVSRQEFQDYQEAAGRLAVAVGEREEFGVLLTREYEVTLAARVLAQVPRPPTAVVVGDAHRTVNTAGSEATVELEARASGERPIVRYRWDEREG